MRTHGPGSVRLVPLPASQRIRKQPVCLLDLQEALSVAAFPVRMEALGELAVGGLDLGLGGVSPESEGTIWVEGLSHQSRAC
jgi:hypothetical protein